MPPEETANIRQERIERLLHELRYEIERGMLEGEIDERLRFKFIVPLSHLIKDGVVVCEFYTEPVTRYEIAGDLSEPRLRVIKGDKP